MDINQEKELIKQSQKDPEAFGQIFDHYYPQIYGFILKRTGSDEIAKDLASETFFQALKNIWRYRITNRPFSAWLYKIAVTQIAQYYRNKGKYCEVTIDNCPELVAHEVYNSDTSLKESDTKKQEKAVFKHVHAMLLKLSDIQHTIIIMKYFEQKKIRDIAQTLDMKENTVKSHLRRGLQKLEKHLIQEDQQFAFIEYVREKLPFTGQTIEERS